MGTRVVPKGWNFFSLRVCQSARDYSFFLHIFDFLRLLKCLFSKVKNSKKMWTNNVYVQRKPGLELCLVGFSDWPKGQLLSKGGPHKRRFVAADFADGGRLTEGAQGRQQCCATDHQTCPRRLDAHGRDRQCPLDPHG